MSSEDLCVEWIYPENGDRLENFQPGLEFYNEKISKWTPSGVITATMRSELKGLYRYPKIKK